MTEADTRALIVLGTVSGLVRPGNFGQMLWPEKRRVPQAFARPAGQVLNRLRSEGFAEWAATGPDRRHEWGWRITAKGREVLRALPSSCDPKVKP